MRALDNLRVARLQAKHLLGAAREDLGVYCAAVYRGYETPPHLRLLIEKLTAVEQEKIDRLAVSKPPRHGGTLTCSTLFPCWYLGRHPDRSIALCTYGADLAFDLGRRVQQLMMSRVHEAIFPEAQLSRDVGGAAHLELVQGGHFYAVGRNEPLTGRGCNVLVVDDAIKDAQEAASPAIREQIHQWYERVGLTRLTPNGAVILVSTRWHEDDLIGHVLAQESAGVEV